MKLIKKFTIGNMDNNAYLMCIKGNLILIDAPKNVGIILSYLKKNKLILNQVWLTHAHFDHIEGIEMLSEEYKGLEVYLESEEFHYLTDYKYNLSSDGFIYTGVVLNNKGLLKQYKELKIKNIRGHFLKGSIYLFENMAFVGDTLFYRSMGNPTFIDGNEKLLKSDIENNLLNLKDDLIVYPGHGLETTIKEEKLYNPYLKRESNG